ncbi:MAG TPA: CCA tRNA nucleotidyltransferase, partial [Alphaproteobacteria bacterium]|nr:CCA tRNA nucleotidyltransferase [Alphaproteobacteria bacterium]
MPDTPEFLPPQPWLSQPETAAVMAALTEGGASARFVGGCVRDALVGRPFSDIDIATPLRPEQVMARLKAAGIHALPTGLQH